MELGSHIRKLRKDKGWNQDEFAQKAYVSRQTVSNWENEKSYPDIQSLLLMSDLFGVTLDELIKGDVEVMKKEINQTDISEYNRWASIYSVMFIVALVSAYPMMRFAGWWGFGGWCAYMAVTLGVAFKVESIKKKHNIQTYREIVAFTEGRTLDDIEQLREQAKRPYQKILLTIGAGALGLVVVMIMKLILG